MINIDELFEKYGFKLTNDDFIFKVYKNNITKEKIIFSSINRIIFHKIKIKNKYIDYGFVPHYLAELIYLKARELGWYE